MISVSIVMVTHNSDWHLGACLDSIFKQDFKDFELVVVDNASKDTTLTILKNKFPNVPVIENTVNNGSCIAWNQGITHTSGKYVLCLNDDVTLKEDFLSKLYSCMEAPSPVRSTAPGYTLLC
jgi:GT2 family glycosyltransferase